MNKNIYLRILEFGEKHREGFNYNQLKEGLGNIETREDEIVKTNLGNSASNRYNSRDANQDSLFFCIDNTGTDTLGDTKKYIIRDESYFNYLDYLELQSAKRGSWLAISIAIISLLFSVGVAWWQIKQPTTLDNDQFQKIIETIQTK